MLLHIYSYKASLLNKVEIFIPRYNCVQREKVLKHVIIHSRYFPDSDWLKAHV